MSSTIAERSSSWTLPRLGTAAVVLLGPMSIALLRGILPYASSDGAAEVVAKISAHQSAQAATLWLTLVAMVTLVPGVIVVGLAAIRASRTIGLWAMALSVTGYSLLWATTTMDFAVLAGIRSGIGPDATTRMLDQLTGDPTQIVAITGFVAGHIAGTILLGTALLRGRAVPSWAAWALIISAPLHLVTAVIIPSAPLSSAAWFLTTIGFAAALAASPAPAPASRT